MAGSVSAFSAAVQTAGWQAGHGVQENTAGVAAQSGSARNGAGGLSSASTVSAGVSGAGYFTPRVPENSTGGKTNTPANYFPPKAETGAGIKENETSATHVAFGQDKDTGLSVIRFVDDSGRVVDQVPPEQLLNSISELWKTAGILVNKSV